MNPATAPPRSAAPPSLDDPALRERLRTQALSRLRGWIPNPSARAERADDIVQETYLRAVQNLGKFDPALGDLGGWLHGYLNLVLMEEYRKSGKQPKPAEHPERWEDLRAKLDPNSNLEPVNDLLDKIPPKNRELIRMRYLTELSPEEIAAKLGISHGAARVQLCRALAQLKDVAGKAGAR